ncbi:MAG: type II toxin-antitoxin system VapC family toxin [Candidatus Kariarchaeaceae archaeon]|jgi:predicted nucleic acid-binding protein
MKFVLDSNFLIAIFRREEKALNMAKAIASEKNIIVTTSINAAELYEGAYRANNTSSHLKLLEAIWERFPVVDFSKSHAKVFGRLKSQIKGKKFNVNDILIASVALEMDAVLVTRNLKDFEITGVKLDTW